MKSILLIKKFGGLVEVTFGLVNASLSLPEWQAVKWLSSSSIRQVFIQTKIISDFIVLNLTADWKKALAQVILMVAK